MAGKKASRGTASGGDAGVRQRTVKGVCIVCGKEKEGIPAKPDNVVLAIRALRSFFRLKPKFTIVDTAHLAEARKKRARFESTRGILLVCAVLFFFLLLGGMMMQSGFEMLTFISAILGAVFIFLLAYARYFPKFENQIKG